MIIIALLISNIRILVCRGGLNMNSGADRRYGATCDIIIAGVQQINTSAYLEFLADFFFIIPPLPFKAGWRKVVYNSAWIFWILSPDSLFIEGKMVNPLSVKRFRSFGLLPSPEIIYSLWFKINFTLWVRYYLCAT